MFYQVKDNQNVKRFLSIRIALDFFFEIIFPSIIEQIFI
jgi:hypothetical protein